MKNTGRLILIMVLALMLQKASSQADSLTVDSVVFFSGQNQPRITDNKLTFTIISEKIRSRGMMKVCITDTSSRCIENLQSGYLIKVYNAGGEEIWAGKTAGRSEMLTFPSALPQAAWVSLKAFKPYVLNKITGTRIYQEKPIEIKYELDE